MTAFYYFNNWSKQEKKNYHKHLFQAAIKAEKYLSNFNDTEDVEK